MVFSVMKKLFLGHFVTWPTMLMWILHHILFLLTPHFFLGLPLSKEYCREESFQVDREDHSVGTTKACVETSFFCLKMKNVR